MDDKQIILEQYRLMLETKEKFTERSFATNKFYYSVSVVLLIAISFLYIQTPDAAVVIVMCAFMGIISSMLLYSNHDTYQYLTHIKYEKVLNELEKQLPVQPLLLEKNALDEKRATFKSFKFVDMQKLFALAAMILFFAFALMQLIPCTLDMFS